MLLRGILNAWPMVRCGVLISCDFRSFRYSKYNVKLVIDLSIHHQDILCYVFGYRQCNLRIKGYLSRLIPLLKRSVYKFIRFEKRCFLAGRRGDGFVLSVIFSRSEAVKIL